MLSETSDTTEPQWYDFAHSLCSSTASFLAETCGDLVQIVHNQKVPLAGAVQFIHRSAFDFLHEEKSKSFIESHCAPYMNEADFVSRLIDVCPTHILHQRRLKAQTIDRIYHRLARSFDRSRCNDLAYLKTRRSYNLLAIQHSQHCCSQHLDIMYLKSPFNHIWRGPHSDMGCYRLIAMRRYWHETCDLTCLRMWYNVLLATILSDLNLPLLEELMRLGSDFNDSFEELDILPREGLLRLGFGPNNDTAQTKRAFGDCLRSSAPTIWAVFVHRWVLNLNLSMDAQLQCSGSVKPDRELEDGVAEALILLLRSGADPEMTLCLSNCRNQGLTLDDDADHVCSYHSLDHIIRFYMPERWHNELLAELTDALPSFDQHYRFLRQKLRVLRNLGGGDHWYNSRSNDGDCSSFYDFFAYWHMQLRFDLVYFAARECDHCGGALVNTAGLCLDCMGFPILCESCLRSLHIGPKLQSLTEESARTRPTFWPLQKSHLGHCTIDLLWMPDEPVDPLDSTDAVRSKIIAWYEQNAEAYGVSKSCDSSCWSYDGPERTKS